jgi:hypothetical protein
VAAGVPVHHLNPAAVWAEAVGAVPGGRRLVAGLLVRASLGYDDATAGVAALEHWSGVLVGLAHRPDLAALREVPLASGDLAGGPPAEAVYVLPAAPVGQAAWFRDLEGDLRAHLARTRRLELPRNRALKLVGELGEDPFAFAERCRLAAEAQAAEEKAAASDKLAARLAKVEAAIRSQERKVATLDQAAAAKSQELWLGTAGSLLGSLLGGRRRSMGGLLRGLSGRQSRASAAGARKEAAAEDLAARQAEAAALAAEGEAALAAIDERWAAVAEQVEPFTIAAEKADVAVDELAVIWVPTA